MVKQEKFGWAFGLVALVIGALAPACSSGDDDASPSAGGSGGSTPGSGGSAQGGSAGKAATVDCDALCGQIKTLCASNPQVDDTWVSVCVSACGARMQVLPESAAQWQACVNAATDCSTGVQCVSTTSGSGGSAGSK